MPDESEADRERHYIEGQRQAYRAMLGHCIRELGYGEDRDRHKWIAEREDVIAILRTLCADFGDNEWDEELHLADVIEKHLGRYLWAKEIENDER